MSSRSRIINTMRNTVLLSLLLGLTWVTALLPYSLAQQYISVILNGSMGVYILGRCLAQPPRSQNNKYFLFSLPAYSVLANRKVRGGVTERLSEVLSTYLATNTSERVKLVGKYFITSYNIKHFRPRLAPPPATPDNWLQINN